MHHQSDKSPIGDEWIDLFLGGTVAIGELT
jgi:hypothetical protein